MPTDTTDLDEQIKRARTLRRLGLVGLAIVAIYLTVPMLIGAFGGAARGELWDPYTGLPWKESSETEAACYDEARRLIAEAPALPKLTRTWDEPAREWGVRCRNGHPDLYRLVTATRADLVERGKKKR